MTKTLGKWPARAARLRDDLAILHSHLTTLQESLDDVREKLEAARWYLGKAFKVNDYCKGHPSKRDILAALTLAHQAKRQATSAMRDYAKTLNYINLPTDYA